MRPRHLETWKYVFTFTTPVVNGLLVEDFGGATMQNAHFRTFRKRSSQMEVVPVGLVYQLSAVLKGATYPQK